MTWKLHNVDLYENFKGLNQSLILLKWFFFKASPLCVRNLPEPHTDAHTCIFYSEYFNWD